MPTTTEKVCMYELEGLRVHVDTSNGGLHYDVTDDKHYYTIETIGYKCGEASFNGSSANICSLL